MSQAINQFKFAVCISNEECEDLQVLKLYRVLPDLSATMDDYLRIIDDSGEDYLYPASRFVRVDFPEGIEQKLMSAAASAA